MQSTVQFANLVNLLGGALNNFLNSVNRAAGGGSARVLADLVEKSHDILLRNCSGLDAVFNAYDFAKYGCLHIGILKAKYTSLVSLDMELLLNQTEQVLNCCPFDHLQGLSVHVRFVAHEYTNKLISLGVPARGITPLINAIKSLQRSPEQLTPLHGSLCQVALAAKLFNPVLPILDTNILEIDRTISYLDARDYLLYFYYGGMIYGALKQWDRSLHFFELCLLLPCFTISCILVEAAKKLILVSLIHTGKFTPSFDVPTPHFMSPKPWKRYCQPYVALASAFLDDAPTLLNSTLTKYKDIYVADQNYGLVKQVKESHVRFRIHNLTKTFMTMSLQDVADRVCLANANEAEGYLLDMIQSKSIFARIDQRDGAVYFLDDPEQYNSAEMFLTLQKKIEECAALEKHLMGVSDQLVNNPNYAKKMLEMEGGRTTKSNVH